MEGVPLHAWSSRFFKIACGGMGRFIKMDSVSERKENLEMARVLISTSIWGDINRLMDVSIGERSFMIKISEEEEIIKGEPPCQQDISDEEDDSRWEDGSQYPVSDGPADVVAQGWSDGSDDSGVDEETVGLPVHNSRSHVANEHRPGGNHLEDAHEERGIDAEHGVEAQSLQFQDNGIVIVSGEKLPTENTDLRVEEAQLKDTSRAPRSGPGLDGSKEPKEILGKQNNFNEGESTGPIGTQSFVEALNPQEGILAQPPEGDRSIELNSQRRNRRLPEGNREIGEKLITRGHAKPSGP